MAPNTQPKHLITQGSSRTVVDKVGGEGYTVGDFNHAVSLQGRFAAFVIDCVPKIVDSTDADKVGTNPSHFFLSFFLSSLFFSVSIFTFLFRLFA